MDGIDPKIAAAVMPSRRRRSSPSGPERPADYRRRVTRGYEDAIKTGESSTAQQMERDFASPESEGTDLHNEMQDVKRRNLPAGYPTEEGLSPIPTGMLKKETADPKWRTHLRRRK